MLQSLIIASWYCLLACTMALNGRFYGFSGQVKPRNLLRPIMHDLVAKVVLGQIDCHQVHGEQFITNQPAEH